MRSTIRRLVRQPVEPKSSLDEVATWSDSLTPSSACKGGLRALGDADSMSADRQGGRQMVTLVLAQIRRAQRMVISTSSYENYACMNWYLIPWGALPRTCFAERQVCQYLAFIHAATRPSTKGRLRRSRPAALLPGHAALRGLLQRVSDSRAPRPGVERLTRTFPVAIGSSCIDPETLPGNGSTQGKPS